MFLRDVVNRSNESNRARNKSNDGGLSIGILSQNGLASLRDLFTRSQAYHNSPFLSAFWFILSPVILECASQLQNAQHRSDQQSVSEQSLWMFVGCSQLAIWGLTVSLSLNGWEFEGRSN